MNSTTNQKKLYLLTDGTEIFARQEMTESEARQANETAFRHTGGNISWDLSTAGVVDIFCQESHHIPKTILP